MQPAPRILELKAQGHNNKTLRVVTCTPDGVKNSAVAKYVLRGENYDNDWLQHLQTLVARFSHLGIDADIDALSLCELWALYCYLSRLAGD